MAQRGQVQRFNYLVLRSDYGRVAFDGIFKLMFFEFHTDSKDVAACE